MDGRYRIGIDVGGTKVAYGLFDSEGNIVGRDRHGTPRGADGPALCGEMLERVKGLLERGNVPRSNVQGIGIAMPSFILYDTGYVFLTSAIENIRNFPMRDYLSQRLDIPFVLDNDSNAAALAEYRHGAGRGSRHMVYMSVSTGIGSGLILNGELFRGSYGWAGESGHMLITPDEGLLCGCGNRGCFMSWASGRYIPDQIRSIAKGRRTLMDLGEKLDASALAGACRAGDEAALEALGQTAHYLAVCLFNIYQLLNVDLFVFGGGLTKLGPLLFDRVRAAFARYDHVGMPVRFETAQQEQDFGIIGAAELAKEL